MSEFRISIIRPQGYVHSSAFQEVAETLLFGLRALNHRASLAENTIDTTCANIILGAHLLTPQQAANVPSDAILYNLEQLGSADLSACYLELGLRCHIWDYSPLNLKLWNQRGPANPPQLVEVGYVPELRRIAPAPVQDIDVLFYGSINERRSRLLLALKSSGIAVHTAFGVYGTERDALISRAKIVLNLHNYETRLFQSVRVSYLLANSKAVVSEDSPDIGDFAQAVALVPEHLPEQLPEKLIAACRQLLNHPDQRHQLEQTGYAFFRQREESAILKSIVGLGKPPEPIKIVLNDTAKGNSDAGSGNYFHLLNMGLYQAIPQATNILELGCAGGRLGELYKSEHPGTTWTGIDINPEALVFARERLDRTFHLDVETDDLTMLGSGYDCIVLGDVLEHLRSPEKLLTTLHSISTPDATLAISVPNMSHISVLERMVIGDTCYDNAGLLDSTHLRFLSQSSFFKMLLDQGWLPAIHGRSTLAPTNTRFTEQITEAAATLGSSRAAAERNLYTYQMFVRCAKIPATTPTSAQPVTAGPDAPRFSVLVALSNSLQAELNILRSPGLQEVQAEIILCRDASNAAEAFRIAAGQASGQWLLYCHQDVYFPTGTGHAILSQLAAIPTEKRSETILGFSGLTIRDNSIRPAGLIVDRNEPFDHPATDVAISLDEFAVVLHRDSPYRIDPSLGWHLWATDLCLQALHHPEGERYARILRVPLYHNSLSDYTLPPKYRESGAVLSAKYPHMPAIPTLWGTFTPAGIRPADWSQATSLNT